MTFSSLLVRWLESHLHTHLAEPTTLPIDGRIARVEQDLRSVREDMTELERRVLFAEKLLRQRGWTGRRGGQRGEPQP